MRSVEFVEAGMSTNFRRWASLVVVCFGQLMIMLDSTIVNVALPSMQRDLGFSQAGLTWVVNAYLIAFGGFLLGLGASLSAGVIIAIIITEFQKPAERAQAMSVFTLVIAGGGSFGLLAGGFLTEWANWHWIFFINLPIGLATLALGAWLIKENEGIGLDHGVDVLGAVLVTAALMVGVYGIVTAADNGWTSTHTFEFVGGAGALLVLFVAVERRVANPIMPMRVLAIRTLTGATVARAFVFAGISTSFFIGVLYLQHVRGFSAMET